MQRKSCTDSSPLSRNRILKWTVEWVHPDGNKTMEKVWESERISSAYDDYLVHRDPNRPKKKRKPDRKPDSRHHDLEKSAGLVSSTVSVHDSTAGEQPSGSTRTASVGKRKREEDEPDVDRSAEGEDPNIATATGPRDSGAAEHSAPIPASDASPVTEPAAKVDFNFYLHHPSLPSQRPVLISLPPDATLARSLINRLVLEFPTIYVFHSQPDGRLLKEFLSEEEFFASAKKDLVEEIADEENYMDGNFEERTTHDLEEGEVNEGRLLEVLGKDLNGVPGLLKS